MIKSALDVALEIRRARDMANQIVNERDVKTQRMAAEVEQQNATDRQNELLEMIVELLLSLKDREPPEQPAPVVNIPEAVLKLEQQPVTVNVPELRPVVNVPESQSVVNLPEMVVNLPQLASTVNVPEAQVHVESKLPKMVVIEHSDGTQSRIRFEK